MVDGGINQCNKILFKAISTIYTYFQIVNSFKQSYSQSEIELKTNTDPSD